MQKAINNLLVYLSIFLICFYNSPALANDIFKKSKAALDLAEFTNQISPLNGEAKTSCNSNINSPFKLIQSKKNLSDTTLCVIPKSKDEKNKKKLGFLKTKMTGKEFKKFMPGENVFGLADDETIDFTIAMPNDNPGMGIFSALIGTPVGDDITGHTHGFKTSAGTTINDLYVSIEYSSDLFTKFVSYDRSTQTRNQLFTEENVIKGTIGNKNQNKWYYLNAEAGWMEIQSEKIGGMLSSSGQQIFWHEDVGPENLTNSITQKGNKEDGYFSGITAGVQKTIALGGSCRFTAYAEARVRETSLKGRKSLTGYKTKTTSNPLPTIKPARRRNMSRGKASQSRSGKPPISSEQLPGSNQENILSQLGYSSEPQYQTISPDFNEYKIGANFYYQKNASSNALKLGYEYSEKHHDGGMLASNRTTLGYGGQKHKIQLEVTSLHGSAHNYQEYNVDIKDRIYKIEYGYKFNMGGSHKRKPTQYIGNMSQKDFVKRVKGQNASLNGF